MTTTNRLALREAPSHQERYFFRSICPLGNSAADGLDQAIRRQVKQAQVGKRRRTGDGRAETEERETEDGGKANARSGANPIGRTGSLGNTVISYAPRDSSLLGLLRSATHCKIIQDAGCSEAALLVSPPIHCQRPEGAQHQPNHSGQGGIQRHLGRGLLVWRHSLHAHTCHFRTLRRQHCDNPLLLLQ